MAALLGNNACTANAVYSSALYAGNARQGNAGYIHYPTPQRTGKKPALNRSVQCRSSLDEPVTKRTVLTSTFLGMMGPFFNGSSFASDDEPVVTDRVYLDIKQGEVEGRVVIGLFRNDCPKTVENFTQLVKGTERGGFKGSIFHRVVKSFVIQGGDYTQGNGFGGYSIYGPTFKDENLSLHHAKGAVAMANRGPNTNSSQFYITVQDTSFLDGKYVVFGQVLEGLDLVVKLNKAPVDGNSRPKTPITIADCGLLDA